MKKLIFVLLLTSPCFAQSPIKVDAQFGATLSAVIYDFEGYVANYSPGMNLGFALSYSFNEKIGLGSGLSLQQRGFKMKGGSGMPSSRIVLGYLSIPVLFSYSPIPKLSISLGPELAVQVLRYGSSEGDRNKLIDGLYEKTIDLGVQGGFGYQITEKISIKAAYFYSLTPVDEIIFNSNGIDQTKVNEYNRSFQLSVGYRIL